MGSRVLRLGFTMAVAFGLIVSPGITSSARAATPSIGLLSVVDHVEIARFPGGSLFLPGGVFLASSDGPFELWAEARPGGGVTVRQMTRRPGGPPTEVRRLPFNRETSFFSGLGAFLRLTWLDEQGETTLAGQTTTFCPASWDASRADDTGPPSPTYPQFCGSDLTKKAIWGIDRGWAVGALSGSFVEDPGLEDGTYTLRIAIASQYAEALQIPSARRTATLSVTLTTFEDPGPCFPGEPCVFEQRRGDAQGNDHAPTGARAGPPMVPANADGLPDLISLPAFAFNVEPGEDGRDYLNFAANVWNAGPGPLVVEGFRHSSAPFMAATQYFYSDGRIVGKAPAGGFEFDVKPDHLHWHFEDFAAYDLLDRNQASVVRSGKQSFCLAPTDPIDMTLPGAQWQPDRIGFGTACGSAESIWIREVLPAGWGDTYFQFLSGQAFDITDVPNGEYLVRVATNSERNLRETSYENNVALRRVRIGGRPGHRTVSVP